MQKMQNVGKCTELIHNMQKMTKNQNMLQTLFLSCPPPLVTKSGPDKGGGHDKIGSKISDLKITNIFGYLPQKKVLLWTD